MPIGFLSEADKQVLERGLRIANVAVIETIAEHCPTEKRGSGVLYDTRPMLDPREHKPASTDWHAELLSYAESVGLIARDRADRHLVKFLRSGQ